MPSCVDPPDERVTSAQIWRRARVLKTAPVLRGHVHNSPSRIFPVPRSQIPPTAPDQRPLVHELRSAPRPAATHAAKPNSRRRPSGKQDTTRRAAWPLRGRLGTNTILRGNRLKGFRGGLLCLEGPIHQVRLSLWRPGAERCIATAGRAPRRRRRLLSPFVKAH
jgi:hypothetical protein